MPKNVYIPSRTPATRWDRILVHPYEHAVAVISLLLGVLLAVVGPLTGATFANGSAFLPDWIDTPSGIVLALGGFWALRGLHYSGDLVSKGWHYEAVGHFFIFAGFAALCLLGAAAGLSITSALFTAALSIGALLRWRALRRMHTQTRRMVEADKEVR